MTKTAAGNPIESVYRRLAEAGFSRAYIKRQILPSWWKDEVAFNPVGLAEGIGLISRHLGVKPSILRASRPVTLNAGNARFKKSSGTQKSELIVAEKLVSQVARFVAAAAKEPSVKVPSTAREIRKRILAHGPWVGLDELLAWCRTKGIVVLHVSEFPPHTKKMHGFALRVGDRPVIGTCWDRKQPAWLLFVLAHELGHIALGHIGEGDAIVDETVDKESDDNEEKQANAFAIELLCGDADTRFTPVASYPRAEQLAAAARQVGRKRQIDPGHVILNYGNTTGFYPVANKALSILDAEADAPSVIRAALSVSVDWDAMAPEAREFVSRVTKTDISSS